MDDLAGTAVLVEEVVRRVLRRYQEHMVSEDYHRRAIDNALQDLPSIMRDAVNAARARKGHADDPSPYDLSARPGRLGVPRSKLG